MKTPTATFGRASVKPARQALGVDVEERRVGEPVERDQVVQRLDEPEDPDELDVVEDDVDLGLARRAGLERQVVEAGSAPAVSPGRRLSAKSSQLGQHLDAHLALAARPARRRRARGRRSGTIAAPGSLPRRPAGELRPPLEAEAGLDAALVARPLTNRNTSCDEVGGVDDRVAAPWPGCVSWLRDERRQLRGGGSHVADGARHRLQRVLQRRGDVDLGGLGDRGDGVEHDVDGRRRRRPPAGRRGQRARRWRSARRRAPAWPSAMQLGRVCWTRSTQPAGRRRRRPGAVCFACSRSAMKPSMRSSASETDVRRVVEVDADRARAARSAGRARTASAARPPGTRSGSKSPRRHAGEVADRALGARQPGDLEARVR